MLRLALIIQLERYQKALDSMTPGSLGAVGVEDSIIDIQEILEELKQ